MLLNALVGLVRPHHMAIRVHVGKRRAYLSAILEIWLHNSLHKYKIVTLFSHNSNKL